MDKNTFERTSPVGYSSPQGYQMPPRVYNPTIFTKANEILHSLYGVNAHFRDG